MDIIIIYNINDKYFRYTVYNKYGTGIFCKIIKSMNMKTSMLLINRNNRKVGENIFDTFFFLGRRIRIII